MQIENIFTTTDLRIIAVAFAISMVLTVTWTLIDQHKKRKSQQAAIKKRDKMPLKIHQYVRNAWLGREQYCDITYNGKEDKAIKVCIENRQFFLLDSDKGEVY